MNSEPLAGSADDSLNSTPLPRFTGWRLKFLVFVAGAVLMGLEMAGSRVLAIHFGSSIYVWGSIIGVFLAALSLGYYVGGMLSDWRPSFLFLNLLILAAGLWLIALPFYDNQVCSAVRSLNLGERAGPLLATTLLFGGPSVLLGIVSPFAVRLSARAIERMGNVSGRLYAISTVGSICGTLATAFWLIPAFRVSTILLVLGTTLVLLPVIIMPKSRPALLASTLAAIAAAASFMITTSSPMRLSDGQSLIFEGDSAYHYVAVVDDHNSRTRLLRFDNLPQSNIDLEPPHFSRGYTNAFHISRIFKPELKRILVIGGGGGVGPRRFTAIDPNVVVDLVEIDPLVVSVSKKYFYLEDGPRLRIHVQDGRKFLRDTKDRYDLVILDAFTSGGRVPFHLTTREFMQELREVLVPGGLLLANIFSALEGERSQIFRAEYKTVATVFESIYLFPLPLSGELQQFGHIRPDVRRNIILVAYDGSPGWTLETLTRRAEEIVARGLAPSPSFPRYASIFYTSPINTDDVPLLTDDFAPVDTMLF